MDTLRPAPPDAPLIVVADDDPASRDMLRRALQSEGHRVKETADGLETLQKCTSLQPDVLLLDVMMPGLSGFEVCARLQAALPDRLLPVLMITSLDDRASIDQAFEAGAADYVTKPVYWPLLRHRLRQLLLTARLRRQLQEERDLLRAVIDLVPDQIYVKNTRSEFVLMNTATAVRNGIHDADSFVGKTDFDFLPEDLAAGFYAEEQHLMRSGEPQLRSERQDPRPGQALWFLNSKVPLRDSRGEIIGLVGITSDITERKRFEESLRQSQALEHEQRLLAEALHDIAKAITSTLDLKLVMTRLLEQIGRVLPHDTANILLVEGNTARAAYWQGYPEALIAFIGSFSFVVDRLPNLRQMVQTGRPCLIANTAADPEWLILPEAPLVAS